MLYSSSDYSFSELADNIPSVKIFQDDGRKVALVKKPWNYKYILIKLDYRY